MRRAIPLPGGRVQVALVPADPYSAELMDEMIEGKEVAADIKQDRRRGELNLYWAGIGLLVANYSGPAPTYITLGNRQVDASRIWPTSRKYHDMLMSATGNVTKLWRRDGTYREDVDSIALDNMGADEFTTYFETARAVTVELFGYDPWQAWKDEADKRRVNKFKGKP